MRRTRAVVLLSVALAVFVALYRFNTLGDSLGGFDDDHFVPLVYAKQVQAGEQPLRDFTGVGLQGVWPSLTYELSAITQSWFGNNLRSEALLTVAGLTLGTVVTFLAASYVAPLPLALGAALLSAFISPKLYNYPKVLLLAAGALGIALYARRPTVRRAAALGVLAAIAFLFRHDYAVYLAVGITAACAFRSGISRGALHVLACGAVSLVLLTPSLLFVQRHLGLATYWQDSVLGSEQEAARTDLPWPRFAASEQNGAGLASFFDAEQNAIAWLYYLHFAVPSVVVIAVWRTRDAIAPEARVTLAAVALMALFVAPFFLRGNTAARFGDMAPLFAVVLAGGCALAVTRAEVERRSLHTARVLMVVAVVAITSQAVWALGGVTQELDTSGWSDSPRKLVGQARRRWIELATLPSAYWVGAQERASARAVQYVHACTEPHDRLLMMSYQPELLPLADRRFAAGRASVIPGFLTDDRHQRALVDRWRREVVPIVLVEEDPELAREIPVIHRQLVEHYVHAGALELDGGAQLAVFVDRHRAVVRVHPETGLPCFR